MDSKSSPPSLSTYSISVKDIDATIIDANTDTRPTTANVSVETLDTTTSSATLHDTRRGQLSTVRLFIAHLGAALTLFLATTDATLVSTSLPTISSELDATQAQYTWVGVAYMLTQTAFQPLYGRISDLVGRKIVLFTSMLIFCVGSLLCGAAQSIEMLIAARALAGIGGGGIVSSVWVITSEIVDVQSRAKWSQALSITWSCSAIAGPLLGGLFSGDGHSFVSWRWSFYMNLPICVFAAAVLYLSLKDVPLPTSSNAMWDNFVRRFDFVGLLLFMSGTSSIVVGFSFASSSGWSSPSTLVLISLGLVVLLCGGVYEKYTTRDPLFPSTAFKDLTVVIILVITFLHNFAFTAGTFYLALFFQAAGGLTPLQAGVRLLPYSLGSSLASMPAAWFIGYRQRRNRCTSGQNWVITAGLLISTLGFGLMILMGKPIVEQVIYPLIAGVGLGMLFHAPYQVFAKALKPSELATGTSAFFLVRFTGATVGLAVSGAVFYERTASRMPFHISESSIDFTALNAIQPEALRTEVLRILSTSVQTVWILCTPCLGAAALISIMLKRLSFDDDTASEQTVTTDSKIEPEKTVEAAVKV